MPALGRLPRCARPAPAPWAVAHPNVEMDVTFQARPKRQYRHGDTGPSPLSSFAAVSMTPDLGRHPTPDDAVHQSAYLPMQASVKLQVTVVPFSWLSLLVRRGQGVIGNDDFSLKKGQSGITGRGLLKIGQVGKVRPTIGLELRPGPDLLKLVLGHVDEHGGLWRASPDVRTRVPKWGLGAPGDPRAWRCRQSYIGDNSGSRGCTRVSQKAGARRSNQPSASR